MKIAEIPSASTESGVKQKPQEETTLWVDSLNGHNQKGEFMPNTYLLRSGGTTRSTYCQGMMACKFCQSTEVSYAQFGGRAQVIELHCDQSEFRFGSGICVRIKSHPAIPLSGKN